MLDFNFNFLVGPQTLDESLDIYTARLELIGQTCGLKHAPEGFDIEVPPAVDYLCQYLGFNEERSITEMLRIPICEECIQGLYDPDWALIYCVTCHSSQWVWKPHSRFEFHTDVAWVEVCPKCYEE